jgi:hypothetical protein
MAKTIHIHLPPGMVVTRTTRDSGDWKESDHPRAKNGQFGSGGGGGSAPAAKKSTAPSSGGGYLPSTGTPEAKQHAAKIESMRQNIARLKALPQSSANQAKVKENSQRLAAAIAHHKEKYDGSIPEKSTPKAAGKPDARPGWEKNEQGNQVPAVGAKVKVVNGPENATVKKVVGNVATLAYTLKSGGKDYPRLEEFHVTKLYPVAGGSPAKPQAPASSSGAPNWSASNGNWDKAKKEGRELVQAKLQEAKTGGDRTDALLALKKQAEVEHKKGSYLAAVVIGEVNDYFDRVK